MKTIFVIAMENHNLTQPGTVTSPMQIMGNPAAPFVNSLMTPGNPNAAQTSWAMNYLNVAAGVHPSEPNYVWAEAGSNLGIFNDNDPFPNNNHTTTQTLSNFLQMSGKTWRSYQEDIDLVPTAGTVNQPGANSLTSTVAPQSQWTVPLSSFSGTSATYTNAYNGSNQYNYAAKHNPMVFFTTTNGGDNTTPSNPLTSHYVPLQQLATDLANNTVAQYNWITADQYNEMHSSLSTPFTYNGVTYPANTDQEAIALGDHFLSIIVPQIMASQAYQNDGAIVIWFDESEGGDTASFTLPEIIISPDAKGNAYSNNIHYTHSSDLLTMQEIFNVGPCLLDACNATDLSDLFKPEAITNIYSYLQNPGFSGSAGTCPTSWVCGGSPTPGFESYAPTTAQYSTPPFATMADAPTVYAGSGIIRQLTSEKWIGGKTYTLNLTTGLPLKQPDGTTPVAGWPTLPNGATRLYLTMGAGFGQVAAFDIPSPGPGNVATFPVSLTLPTNSPAIGQQIGVMIYVSAPSGYAANFSIVP
ncbi:MAG: alkaline phosphatase family protein [Bryobacteraceae bacterium]